MSSNQALQVRRLGILPYEPVWQEMRAFTDHRQPEAVDQLWCLQHEPVFTQGQAGKAEHILNPHGIPVVQTDRGGQVTYHGPGQLMIYLLLDIRQRGLGARSLVDLIEQSIITVLQSWGIEAALKPGAPGVYVDGAKIAALGLRIRRGCSYHGLSLNVDMDLTPFSYINPCGYAGLQAVQLKDLLSYPPQDLFLQVQERLLGEIGSRLL